MPEFILDHGDAKAARRFNLLDAFTQGYIEAAFFTSTGSGDDGDLEHATFAEMAREAVDKIKAECATWQKENQSTLAFAYASGDYDDMQAGRDYWFTRNGHGVGFWDREQLRAIIVADGKKLGDVLSDRARYSERSLYRGDDGKIHYM